MLHTSYFIIIIQFYIFSNNYLKSYVVYTSLHLFWAYNLHFLHIFYATKQKDEYNVITELYQKSELKWDTVIKIAEIVMKNWFFIKLLDNWYEIIRNKFVLTMLLLLMMTFSGKFFALCYLYFYFCFACCRVLLLYYWRIFWFRLPFFYYVTC